MKKMYAVIIFTLSLVCCSKNNKLIFNDEYDDIKYKIDGKPEFISFDEYNHSFCHKVLCSHYDSSAQLFPLEINSGIVKFYSTYYYDYYGADGFLGEIFLEWTADETTFNNEINRVSDIKTETDLFPVFSSNLFSCPSYTAIYNFYTEFYYFIYDINNFKLIYVYFNDIGNVDNLVFENKYKPSKMLYESDFADNFFDTSTSFVPTNQYNMYKYGK